MKKLFCLLILLAASFFPAISGAQFDQFKIRPVSEDEYAKFIRIFSEMRGPLRAKILKDSKKNFEEADPLEYVRSVKDEKKVRKILKEGGLDWEGFNELFGNIILGYYSMQPEATKAGLLRQLAKYNLMMSSSQIPPEYQKVVTEALKTDEGIQMASFILENILQIPPENVELAHARKLQLDQLFYTRFWKDKL